MRYVGPIGRHAVGCAVLFLMMSASGLAQTIGIKIGYPLSNAFPTNGSDPQVNYTTNGRRLKVGLTVGLNLPAGLLLEIDGIYTRLNYDSSSPGMDVLTQSTTAVNCWDLPILVKKRFTQSPIKPYIDAGLAFRAVNADTDMETTVLPGPATQTIIRPLELTHQATAGLALGAGIEFKIGKLHLLPELRYMRFQRENFRSATNAFYSNLKQPEFLLGFQTGK